MHWVFAAFWGFLWFEEQGLLFVVVLSSISLGGSLCKKQALWVRQASVVVACGYKLAVAHWLCCWGMWDPPQMRYQTHVPLHCLADSFPLCHQGSPTNYSFEVCILHCLCSPRALFCFCIFLTMLQVFHTWLWFLDLFWESETLSILRKIVGVEYWFVKSKSRCSRRELAFHWAPTITNVRRAFLCHHLSVSEALTWYSLVWMDGQGLVVQGKDRKDLGQRFMWKPSPSFRDLPMAEASESLGGLTGIFILGFELLLWSTSYSLLHIISTFKHSSLAKCLWKSLLPLFLFLADQHLGSPLSFSGLKTEE